MQNAGVEIGAYVTQGSVTHVKGGQAFQIRIGAGDGVPEEAMRIARTSTWLLFQMK